MKVLKIKLTDKKAKWFSHHLRVEHPKLSKSLKLFNVRRKK